MSSGSIAERSPFLPVLIGTLLAVAMLLSIARARDDDPASDPADTIPTASQLARDGRYAEAEAMARRLLAEAERREGRESNQAADALDVLVVSLFRQGRYGDPEVLKLAEENVALRERLTTDEEKDLANSLTNLGNILMRREDYERARQAYERALTIRKGVYGLEHQMTTSSLNSLANVHLLLGHFEEASSLYLQSLTIQEKILDPAHPDVSRTLGNLAALFLQTGEYDRATDFFQRSLAIKEKVLEPGHPEIARTLSNLGIALTHGGDFDKARSVLERAMAIQEKSLGSEHPDLAAMLNNLGGALFHLGLFSQARRSLERALAILEKTIGAEHSDTVETLVDLGEVYCRTGQLAGARASAERAVRVLERSEGMNRVILAQAHGVLMAALRGEGRPGPARQAGERAAAILESVLGSGHPLLADILFNLGGVAIDMRDDDAAGRWLRRSLQIRQTAYGAKHPEVARSRAALARLRYLEGGPRAALEEAVLAESIDRDAFRFIIRALPEREALAYADVRGDGLDVALAALVALPRAERTATDVEKAWDTLVRSRTVVLDEVAGRHRSIRADATPGAAAAVESYRAAATALARLLVRGPDVERPGRYAPEVRAARDAWESAESRLAERSAPFRRALGRERAGFADVARSLPKDTALLAFSQYRQPAEQPRRDVARYVAFALGPGSARPRVVPLGEASEIEALVETWRGLVSRHPASPDAARGAEEGYQEAAAALRRAVWDPVADGLGRAATVLVVPDGALHLVNLATLPDDGGGFLLETGPTFHYLSAERDVVRDPEPPRSRRTLLAFGGPEFDASPGRPTAAAGAEPVAASVYRGPLSSCADFRSLRFKPLPGARSEVEEITALWRARGGTARGLVGADGDEGTFKHLAGGNEVIHLATHAFFVHARCGPDGLSEEPAPGESPLLLAGLAFSGANNRDARPADVAAEDGILTAEEITAIDLSGAAWVVLSACETGVGVPRAGEGVLGLRRAFEIAGAHTLIMSLWSIEDEAARHWMRGLYTNRLLGLPTSAAVRKAAAALLERQRRSGRTVHPYYWGAFAASGDWR
jgi:tetratricopeptide (TPR) repeat protein/CHAT domain-containing protein